MTSTTVEGLPSGAGNITSSDKDNVSTGSLSPSRPLAIPDLPEEDAHGLSRGHTPEGSEGGDSNDKWENQTDLLSKTIQEEESKIAAENLAEEEEIRRKLEERDTEEKELREKRYKRLMHLLNKSEFYSQFLLKQIETQDMENKKKRVRANNKKAVNKENLSSEENSSQESNKPGRGKKRKLKAEGPASKRHLCDGKYNIGDVINSETVKSSSNPAEEETQEDIERAEQPRLFVNGTMRPYQLDGFSWLTVMYENGVNGILGDEMGLGKTIQCIALVCHLVDKGVPGPFLVVGPLSTLPNWMSEFQRFAPKVPTILYHGSEKVREGKRRQLNTMVTVEGSPHPVYPVVITSYEVIIRDTRILNKHHWRYLCIDEGHRLKNHGCRLTQSLKTFPATNRLLMTGTPLQNNLAELWALLNFLMPEIFDSLDVFESWFDVSGMMEEGSDERIVQQEREKQVIKMLMKILSPFFLRRVKADVHLDLPPKRELLVYSPMTPLQLKMYEATLKMDTEVFAEMSAKSRPQSPVKYDSRGRPIRKAKKDVDYKVFDLECGGEKNFEDYLQTLMKSCQTTELDSPKTVKRTSVLNVKLQNRTMQCRRIVNHPYLLNYPLNEDGSFMVDEGLVNTCGKMQVLDQLLKELHKRGHRVLIFSQMTMMMDIIEDYMTLRPKYTYKRLDGTKRLEERQKDISDYNHDSSIFAFLLSTRAGSLGINLATADTVIIYDSDWNPQCDLQAQDRCHRIGQTKPVLVLRLITANSVDERIVDRAATKRKLEKLIIQSGKFTDGNQREREKILDKALDVDELLKLLHQRDHDRVHQTTKGYVFSQEELNQLLDRSDLINDKKRSENGGPSQLRGVFKVLENDDKIAST